MLGDRHFAVIQFIPNRYTAPRDRRAANAYHAAAYNAPAFARTQRTPAATLGTIKASFAVTGIEVKVRPTLRAASAGRKMSGTKMRKLWLSKHLSHRRAIWEFSKSFF
jgi:hypothetical protein